VTDLRQISVLEVPVGEAASDDQPGEWSALHIFYTASPAPLLTECVGPLVEDLRARRLIAGFFFITYWLEGPHVRLRLRPARAADAAEVRAAAEAAITAFLRRRPALYNINKEQFLGMYDQVFQAEYPGQDGSRHLDENGRMRVRANNSFSEEPYEPEYVKYGGPEGVALAEWHFERSSDTVISILRSRNTHVRAVTLGVAAQLMVTMVAALLPDDDTAISFLTRYRDYWGTVFGPGTVGAVEDFDKTYERIGAQTKDHVGPLYLRLRRRQSGDDAGVRLPDFLEDWYQHCLQLRAGIGALARAGRLSLRSWSGENMDVVDDPGAAALRLVSSYLHMTNNRLHVNFSDEAYLAHVLARALSETLHPEAASADRATEAAP
jgi:hypothetical protein